MNAPKWGFIASGVSQQAVLSLVNAGLVVLSSSGMQSDEFGRFSAALYAMLLATSIARALIGDPLIAGSVALGGRERSAMMAAFGLGVLLVVPMAALAYALSETPMVALLMVPLIPAVCVLDSARCVVVVSGNHVRAMAIDVVGGIVTVAVVASLSFMTGSAIDTLMGLAFCMCVWAYVMVSTRWVVSANGSGMTDWWHASRRYSSSYVFDTIVGAATGVIVSLVVSGQLGVAGLGAYRLGITVFGLASLFVGVSRFHLTMLVARGSQELTLRGFGRGSLGVSLPPILGVLATLAVLVLVPEKVVEALLGASFASLASILPIVAVERVAAMLSVGPIQMLRVLGESRSLAIIRSAGVLVTIALIWPLVWSWDLAGAYFAESLGYLAITIIAMWWGWKRISQRKALPV